MSDTLIGVVLGGKYRITERLGRGGMAEVYLANQENLDRNVAIKLMHAFLVTEQDFLQRFKREARAMAAMNHPNIVSVYDFDVYGENTYYLVMEYISGGTLKDRLASLAAAGERLPLPEAVRLTLQVAEALDYAHGRSMVHRDVKPANIMLNERGNAILTDFGIVKLVGGQSMAYTATGALIGTPAYMSPEQAMGAPGDARSDIYSLGVLLYQMVTGHLPFDADTPLAIVLKHVNDPVPPPVRYNPDVPAAIQHILLKALAKSPDDRYETAGELALALRQADLSQKAPAEPAAPVPTTAAAVQTEVLPPPTRPFTPTPTPPTPAPVPAETAVVTLPPRRGSRLYGAVGLVVLAAIVIAAVFIIRGANQPQQETPIPAVAAADTATATPTPQPTATSTQTPRAPETAAPGETPDVVASAVAAIELTREAQPTSTGTPTRTPSPTPTITPDATAAFLNNCTVSVELVDAYTYQNRSFSSAPIDSRFPANWILRNSGTCSLAADLTWRYVDGETFGYTGGPIPLGQAVPEGEEVTLTATFVAPDAPGSYDSTWQLFDPADNPVGAPLTFSFGAYLPVTATPTAPPVPPTPVATATPEVEITELNYAFEFGACEYVGADWRCLVRLTPYGGGGGPYTLFVYDQPAGQATEFRGPWPANYFAQARRCSAFNSEIRVIDDATGTGFSRHLYVDPDVQFPGGCTLP